MEKSLRQNQELRLQQKLSPMQVRYGRMLEMTGPEVEDEVQRMLDDNPALEIAHSPSDTDSYDSDGFNETPEQVQMADYASEEEIPFYRPEMATRPLTEEYYEPVIGDTSVSLIDTLSAQLALNNLSDEEMTAAGYIIGNLDSNGYLTRGTAALAADIEQDTGKYIDNATMQRALNMVRSLDPPGIGAIDLRDCLLLQLRRLPHNKSRNLAIAIVNDYFDLFSMRHYDKLTSQLGLTADELRDAIDEIRTLNPKPASGLLTDSNEERTMHIVPDFMVEADGNHLTVSLPNRIPELSIDSAFSPEATSSMPHRGKEQQDAATFINQKRDEAAEFIKILKMRQVTLFRVMEAIVRLQKDFFLGDGDTSLLHPMILKDVAALTGYNLSVISRATAGKYVATMSGVYPLKMFFNERTRDDDDTSSHEVMNALKAIVDAEDKIKPLSDEALSEALSAKGYEIARRTVAKYRERLGIPVARLRRGL